MKNAAMQHALANAEKKSRTVPAGTLSLASQHNKRSTDHDAGNMQKAEAMPQAAEAALQAAVQHMHDAATKGTAVNVENPENATEKVALQSNITDIGDIPRVVFRADHRLNGFVFLVDTMDANKNTIFMYDLAHGGDAEEVPVDFYRTLKPMDVVARDKATRQITKRLGVNRIVVRDRLLKSHMLERDTEGKVDTKGLNDLEAKLLNAVKEFEQAIQAAFKTA